MSIWLDVQLAISAIAIISCMVLIIALIIPLVISLLRDFRTRCAARSASVGTSADTNRPTLPSRTRTQTTPAQPAYSS